MWGISYPGFYTSMGMIDAHPALKAASPQAPVADWFIGDDWHHNGAFMLPHDFNFYWPSSSARPAGPRCTEQSQVTSTTARPTATSSSCAWARWRTPTTRYFKATCRSGTRSWPTPTYDAFWKARNVRPHLQEHHAGRDDRGRLVRRRGPVRGAGDLPARSEPTNPRHHQHAGDGPVDPRRAGPRRRRLARARSASTPRRRRSTASTIELPFFEHFLKGQGAEDDAARGVRLRDRHQPVAHASTPGRRRRRRPTTLYLQAGGTLASTAPSSAAAASTSTSAIRPSRCRISSNDRHRHARRVHDRRPALRRHAARRAGLPDRAASTRTTWPGRSRSTLHVSTTGTDSDWVVKLIDVYPDDYPDPEPEPEPDVQMGGYQQLVRGERCAASSATASRSPSRSSPASRRRSRSPCPTSATRSGAATASWCRCRAPGSRWWTATRRRSWTFRRRSRRTSRRRPSGCIYGPVGGSGMTVRVLRG